MNRTLFRRSALSVSLFALHHLFLTQSCKEPLARAESVSPVTQTGLPRESVLGEPVVFPIKHYAHNGCGRYSRTSTIEDGNSVTVTLFATYDQGKGVGCPEVLLNFETRYAFTPKSRGTYLFHFRQQEGFLIDTLTVK
jgi:hypothetical protein